MAGLGKREGVCSITTGVRFRPGHTEWRQDIQTEHGASIHLDIPFYRQRWDFTCGPASLMMAKKYPDDGVRRGRDLEIDVWREANLVAARGTRRYGLAYAAAVRGFSARATSNTGGIDFLERLVALLDAPDTELLREQFFERRAGAESWASGNGGRRSPPGPYAECCC